MTTRSPRSRLPAPERRGLIVDAALREFAARGYEAASMGRIAAMAGISRTVLYDHFPSKHALFVELLTTQHEALLAHLGEPIVMDAPMRERMVGTFDAFFRFAEDRPLAWRLLFPEHPPVDARAAEVQRRMRATTHRMLAGMVEADARRTGVDPDSVVGRVIFGIHLEALHGTARWWHAHPDVPRQEIVQGVVAALWTGMGAVERGEPWVQDG